MMDGFSVIMPTFNQSGFIKRAIISLQNQTLKSWELIIINDGSTDDTEIFIRDYINVPFVKYIKNKKNRGLGFALNQGLQIAKYNYIAYLPSDDFYYPNHLETLLKKFQEDENIILVFSGIKYETADSMTINMFYLSDYESNTLKKGYCLQLVQCAHKKTKDKWLERSQYVTSNLHEMFWNNISFKGFFIPTNLITCYWTSHPHQRHRIISESYGGGLNYYRSYYSVETPIKMKFNNYKFTNEEELYQKFRGYNKFVNSTTTSKPLTILIVGELAYNSERIYALEQAGHKLYGLWVKRPTFSFNTVGPLPFGSIEDISETGWKEKIKEINPDIIYALLNFTAVPLAYKVLRQFPNLPFVWHFKEGPSVCLRNGLWKELIYLYAKADGRVFINETVKKWFEQFVPQDGLSFIMDGDLPKKDYFEDNYSAKLSSYDNQIHTVVSGRVMGITHHDVDILAKSNIHIHIYTDSFHIARESQIQFYKSIAPKHIHTHPNCSHNNWVKEFSKYDAGWLHCFSSFNGGRLMNASWDDLNIPARINTYAAAGIPMIQKNNFSHIVAMQSKTMDLDIGIFFESPEDLATQLNNKKEINRLSENVKDNRCLFTFDYYIPQLIDFFKQVIRCKKYG